MKDFQSKSLLVTGGAGFIGSHFIRLALEQGAKVVNLDALTYAGNPDNLRDVEDNTSYSFYRADITDANAVEDVFNKYAVDAVVHFAAESHVDRSIDNASPFVRTNVEGTLILLEAARKHGVQKFVHVSTDEVYGALELDTSERFCETTPMDPHSPYSASKAASDMLALAFHRTHGLSVSVTRCSNNYGPNQFPEKLIPVIILNAIEGKNIPVYGDGLYVRDWIHVTDHCRGVWAVLSGGGNGEVYNIGADSERANIDMVKMILQDLHRDEKLIEYVKDRPGHDRRYAISSEKIRDELGWKPQVGFADGMKQTIDWYRENSEWIERIRSGAYRELGE